MKEAQIRWKQTDYLRLGQAVATFNRRKKKLETEENRSYIPEDIEYKELKESIKTRKELNRQIELLRSLNKDNIKMVDRRKSRTKITEWEYNKIKEEQERAIKYWREELKEIKAKRYGYKPKNQVEIEARIKNLGNLARAKGYDYKQLKWRITYYGRTDYRMRKAIVYRENYLGVLKRYEHYQNYDLLQEKLRYYQNPIKFYELMKQGELLVDLTYQSDQHYGQADFNRFLIDIGISEDLIIDSEE